MITSNFSKSNKVLVISLTGALTADELSTLSDTLNDHINQTDIVPNLILHISQMPHWDGFAAMKTHFNLVKNHHHLIKKVAVVSDSLAFSIIPYIMDHFIAAKVRHFSEDRMEDANIWAEAEDDHPGKFELLDDLPRDVVGIRACGIITAQDYEKTLSPLINEKLKTHDHLKLLFILDDGFDSYSEGAAWDDMRFGFSHLTNFSRIAIVTDHGWIKHGAKLFGPLMMAEVHIFDVKDLEDARSWIKR